MKNVLKPRAKAVLIPPGLPAAVSKTDATIHKKMFESNVANEEMNFEF